ncbi:MAG: hypothetical protein JXB26_04360 [Candidatus Aminicenantes bacterium]|nr:hypothetical protein [Candidatus Aminicenantes bacterium]
MNKTNFFSFKFVVLIILILGFDGTMFGVQDNNSSTFQIHSNLPGFDRGIAVIETSKGDILAVGVTKKIFQANGDILLVCTDRTGNIKWTRTYGGEGDDMGWAIMELPSGELMLAGTGVGDHNPSRDMMVIKTDGNGKVIWTKTYGTEKEEYGWDMIACSDGHFMIAGEVTVDGEYAKGNQDVFVIKMDADGEKLWSKTYGGQKSDRCYSLTRGKNGYYLLGSTNGLGKGDQDAYLIKIDDEGKKLWEKTYGSEKFDMGHDIFETHDGNLAIIGYSKTNSKGENDAWVMKVDVHGHVLWETVYGGEEEDRAVNGLQDKEGNFYITGYTKSYNASIWDLFLLKIDSHGETKWWRNHSGINADLGYGISLSKDGGILLSGQTFSFGNQEGDLWLLKTDTNGKIRNSTVD